MVFAGLYPERGLSVHDKLCRLLFLCSAIKDAGAQHLRVVAPYLCYSRKEQRIHPQDPIITRYVATLMEASHIDSLTTMDVHSKAAFDNAFRIPTQHLENTQLFADYFIREHQGGAPVATSPDLGGIKRTERFARLYSNDWDIRLPEPAWKNTAMTRHSAGADWWAVSKDVASSSSTI